MSFPQDDPTLHQLFRVVATKLLVRIPESHLLESETELNAGVSAQMLVGEEQNLVRPFQSPAHDGPSVRGRTDRPVMASTECFDAGGRIHVGDRGDLFRRDPLEFFPAGLHLVQRRHVCHRATRVQVRQGHFLVGRTQDVGAFRHEMDAAKHDVFGVSLSGSPLGKLE